MPHIDLPLDYTGQRTLQKQVNKKYEADGEPNILDSFFTEQSIVMANDMAAGLAADVHDANSLLFYGNSQAATVNRDAAFNVYWGRTIKWAQFLKPFMNKNLKLLVAWGFPIDNNGKFNYPTTFAGRTAITISAIKKHQSYPAGTSPLQPFITTNGDDMAALLVSTTNAIAFDESIASWDNQAQIETQDRDQVWHQPQENMRETGNYLLRLYVDSPKDIGLWGYSFVTAATPPSLRTVTVLPLKHKIVSGIVLGSVLENTGNFPFDIYKSKKMVGTPITVAAGATLGMNKGYSTIVANNTQTIGVVKFTVTTV